MERLSTGNARLDEVLGGGLVLDAITLVVGAPGTGKTILAEQCLFANATTERPGLYLATVSEPFDKLLRYGQALEFFDTAQLNRSVFYGDLGDAVHQHGLAAVLERLDALIKQHQPGVVVIDSFKALRTFAADEAEFRRFLHDLAGRLTALAVSSLWVGEYGPEEATDSPEFAVADGVIALETRRSAERSIRYLSVRKLRGSNFLSGDHVYRITAGGLVVFPRLADIRDDAAADRPVNDRVSTGIAALDEALEEGYWSGSTTLIAGPSGAGKSLMGLHFVFAGAALDEPGSSSRSKRTGRNWPASSAVSAGPSTTPTSRSSISHRLTSTSMPSSSTSCSTGSHEVGARRLVVRQPQRSHRRRPRPDATAASSSTRWCNAALASASASCSPTKRWNCSGSHDSANLACPTSPTTSSSSNTSKTVRR